MRRLWDRALGLGFHSGFISVNGDANLGFRFAALEPVQSEMWPDQDQLVQLFSLGQDRGLALLGS
jgi:hypothetical protein